MRVVAAMSGGVDSAVAAARMLDAGHEVVGVHLALSQSAATLRESARGCCTIEDAGDARRVADVLGIPFYVWDMAERFRRDVVEDFVAEYSAGRTPNPCLRCNEKIKFAALLDKALALGFDAVATGHYAQVVERPDGTRELHRA
ncbi:MAG TPA: tRNA 2-thiouridine(34) synthase MnmA, partial [Pedococcus sp.]|nr:tRNA 2-thiouridine(34) synthase MnmA [Pedococcus sp.]